MGRGPGIEPTDARAPRSRRPAPRSRAARVSPLQASTLGHASRRRVRRVADRQLDLVDVPAVESATAVSTEVEPQPEVVARVRADHRQIDLRLTPTAVDLATVGATEARLTR